MAHFDTDINAEQEPIFDTRDTEYTIYVNSLPPELDEIAIREVFNQYGKIIGMFYPSKATWAYITYKSYREAEYAIRELNDRKPLYLKVALSKKRSVIKEEDLKKPHVSEISRGSLKTTDIVPEPPAFACNDIKYQQGMGRGQPLNAVYKHFAQVSDKNSENGSSPLLSQISNPYELEKPAINPNGLWTRGVVTVTENGRRHVSLGRGYTLYEIPEPNPNVQECIKKVFEKRHNGLYEHGEDKLKNGVQKCLICSNKTNKHCEKCNTYYCSTACQKSDLSRHQMECQCIPRLVEESINDMSLLQINTNENQTKMLLMSNNIITSKTIASNDVKLRRPNNAIQIDKSNSPYSNANQQVLSEINTKDFSKPNHSSRDNTNEDIETSRRNDRFPTTTLSQNHNLNYQNDAIKKTTFNREKFDNGNIKDADRTIVVDVKEQSDDLTPPMENASRMKNMEEKFVPEENIKLSSENIKASMIQVPCIIDAIADSFIKKRVLESEYNGLIQINESTQENIYSASLVCQDFNEQVEMILTDLQEKCVEMQEPANYKPRTEELICGEGKEDGCMWYRGYISASSTSSDLRIIAIDEARIVKINKILPCPEKFLNLNALGIICEVTDPKKLEVGEVYKFTTMINEQNHRQEKLNVKILKESEFICKATIKSWISMIKSPFPAFSEIKSGSKICFTSYRNHYHVFARSLDEEAIEYYINIMQRVAQCARTAPRLPDPPSNMKAVIAPFSDNNSYRAIIIKTWNDKAQIVYIDFGNVDEVDIKDLQVLPDNLSLQRSCSAKISLKDIPSDVSMNPEVDLYLRELVANETPLTCVYEGDPLKDGVYLTMPTGESVNDKIKQLLVPSWKKGSNDDTTCYMLQNLECVSLGRVGDTVDAMVLDTLEGNYGIRHMIGPFDIELYTYVNEAMPKLLREYCEKTDYYIPRKSELCLALYEGEWYRATCSDPKKSHTTAEVIYIDYGNLAIVEHKNIRLMSKDFMTPAAVANTCTVVNLAPVDKISPKVQQRIKELIQSNNTIVKIKLVDSPENGDYNIELVDIKRTLIQEGLIPSS